MAAADSFKTKPSAFDIPEFVDRLFRIIHRGATAGYVILNDLPEQLLVAQCDASADSTELEPL